MNTNSIHIIDNNFLLSSCKYYVISWHIYVNPWHIRAHEKILFSQLSHTQRPPRQPFASSQLP